MALDAKADFVGLVTATGEVAASPGALRIADNVTLRKEGALALRSSYGSTALSRTYYAAIPYKGTLFYFGTNNAVFAPNETLMPGGSSGAASPALRADITSAEQSRGNLYIASRQGIFKITGTSVTNYIPAGVLVASTIQGVGFVTTGTPLIMTAGQRVAYRVVAKYTDANGLVIRSRPSGAYIFDATTNCSPSVSITQRGYWDNSPKWGEYEVYRTRIFPNTVAVDDEMQLVHVYAHPGAPYFGTYTFTDRTLDVDRGATLYTSPSRGGIENANDRPPGAACLARYRGSLFFGNTVGPRRITISYPTMRNVTGSITGIGVRDATANWTSGSNNLTSVSNTAGLQVGMLAAFSGGTPYYAGGSPTLWITGIAGATVTLNGAATANATGGPVRFFDAIHLSSGSVYNVLPSGTTPWNMVGVPGPTGGVTSGWGSSPENYLAVGGANANVYRLTPPIGGFDQTLVVESLQRGPSPTFAIRASHGDEFNPPIALASDPTGTIPPFDETTNGLAWSEPDEPEHVPPKNFARVGDAGKAILALAATKDRLLIFKEDGLYMLVGDTSKNFGIYPLDTTCRCILPGSVQRLQNTVYALTNLGLVAVDESGGVQVVSRPIQNEVASIVTTIRTNAKNNGGLYYMPGLTGVTGTADDPNGEYWLALGSTTPSFGGQALVYNAFRQGFTTYSFGTPAPVALAQDGEGQPLVLTASTLLTPTTTLGAITARISPRAFSDPALLGKLWTHVCAGFSQLTGTASVTAKFSGSESMVAGTEVTEVMEAPTSAGLIQLPGGSLLRHPMPRAMARGFLSFVELVVAVTSGTFTLELLGMESRENIANKRPTHGSGAT